MKTTIKQVIFTDKRKDGTEQINKNGDKFYMLHLELENGVWVSKYYSEDKKPNIEAEKEYEIEYEINGFYKNLISVKEVINVNDFIEAFKSYGFGFDEEQTWEAAEEMENCTTIRECESIVEDYMNSGALEGIYGEINCENLL